MNENVKKQLDILAKRYPELSMIVGEIENTYLILEECYCNGGKLLVAGNGGSAADSEHIVGELMKGFENPRKLSDEYKDKLIAIDDQMGAILANNLQMALPAIALDGHVALTTAYMNDCEPLLCFAQQINGYGRENDVFLGISTSGNSKNILYAAVVAKAKGMKVVALTGEKNSKLSQLADVTIKAPQSRTYVPVEELMNISLKKWELSII